MVQGLKDDLIGRINNPEVSSRWPHFARRSATPKFCCLHYPWSARLACFRFAASLSCPATQEVRENAERKENSKDSSWAKPTNKNKLEKTGAAHGTTAGGADASTPMQYL